MTAAPRIGSMRWLDITSNSKQNMKTDKWILRSIVTEMVLVQIICLFVGAKMVVWIPCMIVTVASCAMTWMFTAQWSE